MNLQIEPYLCLCAGVGTKRIFKSVIVSFCERSIACPLGIKGGHVISGVDGGRCLALSRSKRGAMRGSWTIYQVEAKSKGLDVQGLHQVSPNMLGHQVR